MINLSAQIADAEQEWLEMWERGPVRTRWERIPLQAGDSAPDFELLDFHGQPRHLSEFWDGRPALLLFWRHYGCSCGRARAKRLQEEHAQYVALGANVVVVGQGEPARAKAYANRFGVPCPVLCDPTYKVYEAYDLLQGKASQILFDADDELLQCDLEAGRKFHASRIGTEKSLVDDPFQLPGEFVVDKNGIVRLAYRYQYCEDWPNPLVLVAGIKEAIWEND